MTYPTTQTVQPVPLKAAPFPWMPLLTLGPMAVILWLAEPATPLPLTVLFSVILLGLAAFILSLRGRLGLGLGADGLHVRHASGTEVWPYHELKVAVTEGKLGLRHSGVGMEGYHSGYFAWHGPESGLKQVQAFATVTRGGVLVRRTGSMQPCFLTPADPNAFAEALAARGA